MSAPDPIELNGYHTDAMPDTSDASTWNTRVTSLWAYLTGALPADILKLSSYNQAVVEYVSSALGGASSIVDAVSELQARWSGDSLTTNGVIFGGGEHRLTDNDGGGNANLRFGNEYSDGADRGTIAGGSGVHIKADVDGEKSVLRIRMLRRQRPPQPLRCPVRRCWPRFKTNWPFSHSVVSLGPSQRP